MKFINGKIFLKDRFVAGGIEFDERIRAAGSLVFGDSESIDLKGAYVIPGLVDIHTHGAMGEDASDGKAEGLTIMAKYYAKEGVTSFLPTTMTLKEPELARAMIAIKEFKRPSDGAKISGIHMEGPFVSYKKRGAQNADNLHAPDIAMFHRLNDLSGGLVKLITIAPEEEGAIPFIKEVSKICAVSVGHTTADYEISGKAFLNGADHATHLYNGMPGIHHRAPAVIGAAFDHGAYAELIPDGFHIDPSVIRMTERLFGDHLVLISDSLRCAGMPDGDYMLGGQPITMKSGKAVLSGSDTLAGSSIHLMEGVRRAVAFGIPLERAVYAASTAAARSVRMDEIGSLTVGSYADLVILDEGLQVKAVYINGKEINRS